VRVKEVVGEPKKKKEKNINKRGEGEKSRKETIASLLFGLSDKGRRKEKGALEQKQAHGCNLGKWPAQKKRKSTSKKKNPS